MGEGLSRESLADKEWEAIRAAAKKLKVEWSDAKPPSRPRRALRPHPRARCASADRRQRSRQREEEFKSAATRGPGRVRVPYSPNAHGPACAVVEFKDPATSLWARLAKPAFRARVIGIALILAFGRRKEGCARSGWSASCYGRRDRRRAAIGRRCAGQTRSASRSRVQYTREQAKGWDPKGLPRSHRARAAIERPATSVAYGSRASGFSRHRREHQRRRPQGPRGGFFFFTSAAPSSTSPPTDSACRRKSYESTNKRFGMERSALLDRDSPVAQRASARSVGRRLHFRERILHRRGGAAIGVDPVEFRFAHVQGFARDVRR